MLTMLGVVGCNAAAFQVHVDCNTGLDSAIGYTPTSLISSPCTTTDTNTKMQSSSSADPRHRMRFAPGAFSRSPPPRSVEAPFKTVARAQAAIRSARQANSVESSRRGVPLRLSVPAVVQITGLCELGSTLVLNDPALGGLVWHCRWRAQVHFLAVFPLPPFPPSLEVVLVLHPDGVHMVNYRRLERRVRRLERRSPQWRHQDCGADSSNSKGSGIRSGADRPHKVQLLRGDAGFSQWSWIFWWFCVHQRFDVRGTSRAQLRTLFPIHPPAPSRRRLLGCLHCYVC